MIAIGRLVTGTAGTSGHESIVKYWKKRLPKETIAVEEAAAEVAAIAIEEQAIWIIPPRHYARRNARARPDLLTGELKLPKVE